jgi:hypothetical protein
MTGYRTLGVMRVPEEFVALQEERLAGKREQGTGNRGT